MKLFSLFRNSLEALSDPRTFWQKLLHPQDVSFMFCKSLKAFSCTPEGRKIDYIIDVGANAGQFAFMARYCWPASHIDCFEPDPNPFELLKEKYQYSQHISLFDCALGEEDGELPLLLGVTSAQNSFLVEHNKSAKGSKSVPVKTLNGIYSENNLSNTLLKVDVQGYELQVLRGGSNILSRLKFILLEVSLAELYENGARLDEIWYFLRRQGYSYAGIIDQYKDPHSGRILQMDVIFENMNFLVN
jgi:FkbM family methyltransferase